MRVEPLCDLSLQYVDDDPVVIRPYGEHGGQGFGAGTGRATGRLEGDVRWSNYPRRREDGVFLPDIRGVIETSAGPVLWEMHGISAVPDERDRRHLVGTIRLCSEAAAHRWLNDCIAVHEGELDLESGVVRLPVWLCLPDRDTTGTDA